MDVVILLVFVSLALVAAGLFFFVHRLREGDFEHGDRLALAPLADDESGDAEPSSEAAADSSPESGEPEGGRPHVES